MRKLIIGVVVASQKANHFAMARMLEAVSRRSPFRLKNQGRLICANVSKPKHPRIVMEHMQNCNEWENRYQQGQTGWDRGDVSPNLLHWIESGFLRPCRILVPGCGNGHEVLALAEKGFDVVAIDIAPTPIDNLKKALKARQLSTELIQSDFFGWKSAQAFDAIYEQTSLCAINPDQWKRYENCLYNWLKPNGKLLAQFMQTGQESGPPFHCDIAAMVELFDEERWLWSDEHKTQAIHSKGLYEKMYLLEKVIL